MVFKDVSPMFFAIFVAISKKFIFYGKITILFEE